MNLRSAIIKYSKNKAKISRQQEHNLKVDFEKYSKLVEDNPSRDALANLKTIKCELESINAIKTEGLRIRSRAQDIEEGERGTKYFLNLEKRRSKLKSMTKLKLDDNTEICDSKTILAEQKKFYKNLYKDKGNDSDFDHVFLTENIPKISETEQTLCDEPITKDEIKKALEQMKPNKSPGTDGFSPEFYRHFWDQISDLVHDSIMCAYTKNILSSEQKRAVLQLIPKKDKDITKLKNWRPISLLNTDYKLLTHTLANRLQKVLPSVISKDQSGYLKNRYIGLNIRTIVDIINDVQHNENSALITLLDFEKAFDTVNWKFMHKCLEKFGFGNSFKNWIKILYTNIQSCVINNGTTSSYFAPECGIRQGCPLSALLFIITAETLSINLRLNSNIRGVHVNKTEFKITQLADDTTLFLKDIPSLQTTLNTLFMFHKCSGLKLNLDKTEILQVGQTFITNRNPFKLKWKTDSVYALGSWFYKKAQDAIIHTHRDKLQHFKNLLNIWSARPLTWIGKITILKMLGISKLNYIIANLETPGWFATEVIDSMNKFLWNNKPPRVKCAVMHNRIEDGGLRLTDFNCYIKAQKSNWIKRLVNNKETVPFKYLIQFLPEIKFEDFLKCSIDPETLPHEMPTFYRQEYCFLGLN
jgi:hypothetical protein